MFGALLFSKQISPVYYLALFHFIRFLCIYLTAAALSKFLPTNILYLYEQLNLYAGTFTFALWTGIVQYYLANEPSCDEREKKVLLGQCLIVLWAGSLLAGIGILLLGLWRLENEWNEAISWFAISTILTSSGTLLEYYFFVKKEVKKMLLLGAIYYIIMGILTVYCLYVEGSIIRTFQYVGIVSLIKLIISIFIYKNETEWTFEVKLNKKIGIGIGLLIGVSLVGGLADYLDGFIVGNYVNEKEFILYRYGARELPFSLILANAFAVGFSNKIAEGNALGKLKEVLSELRKESWILFPILFIPTILLMVFSKEFFAFMNREEFASASTIFNIYLLLIMSRLLFPQAVILGLGKNNILFKVSIIEFAVHFILSIILVQHFGTVGVAWATVIAYMVDKILLIGYCWRLGVGLDEVVPLRFWVIWTAILIGFYLAIG